LTVRVVIDTKEFQSLEDIWHSLLQRCGQDSSIFLTHERLSTWWRHFGEGKSLNILIIERGQEVIGIIPLVKTRYRLGFIKLEVLETLAASNCNYIGLASAQNRDEVINTLLMYLEKELTRGSLILKLIAIPEDSQFLHALRRKSVVFSKSLFFQEEVTTLAPYITLPATWDEYLSSLGRKRRQLLRRELRGLEKVHKVQFGQYTPESLHEALSKFFELHQKRWHAANVSGKFSQPKMMDYFRELASEFLKRNWLHFSYLTIDDEVVSAIYGCIHNHKFYTFISARDIRYPKYSIGHLHYMFLIKDTIGKRLREFDFLKGMHPYKFYWTKSVKKYTCVMIIKARFYPGLRLKFIEAFLRLYEVRQLGLRETYNLILIKRREKKERKRMRLDY
jgi:CelD/BcsL family acetyltransferase involved in cellulose biosynthesis